MEVDGTRIPILPTLYLNQDPEPPPSSQAFSFDDFRRSWAPAPSPDSAYSGEPSSFPFFGQDGPARAEPEQWSKFATEAKKQFESRYGEFLSEVWCVVRGGGGDGAGEGDDKACPSNSNVPLSLIGQPSPRPGFKPPRSADGEFLRDV